VSNSFALWFSAVKSEVLTVVTEDSWPRRCDTM